jgi:WD40 repeat protein
MQQYQQLGHGCGVTAVAFSCDGNRVASSGTDGRLILWDKTSRFHISQQQALDGHKALDGHNGVWGLAFSPDGSMLASASDDSTVKIWDLSAARGQATCIRYLTGHKGGVIGVAFSPITTSGVILASSGSDRTIKLWRLPSGKGAQQNEPYAQTLENAHEGRITSVAFFPCGTRLASSGDDKTVRLWELKAPSGALVSMETLEGHSDRVSFVVVYANSTLVASSSYDTMVRVWDVTGVGRGGSAQCIRSFPGNCHLTSLAVTSDGSKLVAGGTEGVVLVCNAVDGTCREVRGHRGTVWSVATSPNGTEVVSCGEDEFVRLCGLSLHWEAPSFPSGLALIVDSNGAARLWRNSDPQYPSHNELVQTGLEEITSWTLSRNSHVQLRLSLHCKLALIVDSLGARLWRRTNHDLQQLPLDQWEHVASTLTQNSHVLVDLFFHDTIEISIDGLLFRSGIGPHNGISDTP